MAACLHSAQAHQAAFVLFGLLIPNHAKKFPSEWLVVQGLTGRAESQTQLLRQSTLLVSQLLYE